MRASFIKSLIIAGFLTLNSFAIMGLGVHWAPNFGAQLDGSSGIMLEQQGVQVSLDQEEASGLQGAGVKFWIDFIPFVDIDATLNLQMVRYNANVTIHDSTSNQTLAVPLKLETGLPFVEEASPVFGKITGDLSVVYPFFSFPPAVKMLKLYAGAGISYVASTSVLDDEFTKNALEKAVASDPNLITGAANTDAMAQAVTKAIIDAYTDEESALSSGIGGHLIVGAKIKPPIIPIAVYANGKYHLGGGLPDAVSSGFTAELGAALAF